MHETQRPERRRSRRVTYEMVVYFAELDAAEERPEAESFRPVESHDLSAEGMSFLSDREIDAEKLLISVTPPENADHMILARLAYCRAGYWDRKRQYQIGCEFLKKVRSIPAPPDTVPQDEGSSENASSETSSGETASSEEE